MTNLVKMVAYPAESELVRAVAPHYRRVDDEGRVLIQAALLSAADLDVARRPSCGSHSCRRDRRIAGGQSAALGEELNSMNTVFPASRLRMHYAVHTPS